MVGAGVLERHHHALTRRPVSACMPRKTGCLWAGGTLQRVLENFFLLNHITVYSFHLAQVFTERLLGTRCCAGNWGDQGTKRTGSLPPGACGVRPKSGEGQAWRVCRGSVLDPVVREGLSEEGAFEQSPNKMKGQLCKFCSQNIPGRGNSWEDDQLAHRRTMSPRDRRGVGRGEVGGGTEHMLVPGKDCGCNSESNGSRWATMRKMTGYVLFIFWCMQKRINLPKSLTKAKNNS